MNALARNALARLGDSPLAPTTTIKLTVAGESLAHDGCDYIEGIHIFLAVRECPEDAQGFVVALAGLSQGNSKDYFKATDEQIAGRLNTSTKTVQRKRKALVAWSESSGFAVVQIKEGTFDRTTGKNAVTEYRVPLVEKAERLVKWSRENQFWQRHPRTAITQAAMAELQEAVDAEADDLPAETVTKARAQKKNKVKEHTPAEVQFTERKNKALRLMKEVLGDAPNLGYSAREIWSRMVDNVERHLEASGLQ